MNQYMSEETLPAFKHSGYGIASFFISLICGLSCVILLVVFFTAVQKYLPGDLAPTGILTPEQQKAFMEAVTTSIELKSLFYTFFVIAGIDVVGFGFGIAGLFQKNRKRALPIIGIIFSIPVVLLFFGTLV
ncbi:hypothetical protein ABND12_10940 [Paenibacillus larvae]|uniref:hypothetical protein n=1 Tax=Paenibacillus larvae TaxID=1464 RepID=UPI0011843175|nr:hypothetical protein [Paenibacillus larvae]MDR5582901.1 hypothetical protein [Paenibacillus larvae]MDR5594578.1 hypothetical protein [Paenibacillus larvae]MDR5598821.1 hypothetical protein [Paenibacillus larvae]MDT2310818.1 hypothetical protein [Paenibacillus larvae]MDV3483984.1 hypothetical protein [Paenibacillus larvae]